MQCIHREQVELCVDILERILAALSPLCVVQNYRAELQAGLTHPNETVKILALTQVILHIQYTQPSIALKPLTSCFPPPSFRLEE